MRSPLALVADIGGTYVRFGLTQAGARPPLLADSVRQLTIGNFESLSQAAEFYFAETGLGISERPGTAVLAVAGRVEGDIAQMTNHRWRIDGRAFASDLSLRSVQLINDFSAQALAVEWMQASDLAQVGQPPGVATREPNATFAVLGPGTGLGVSALLRRHGVSLPLVTEGGHAAFAPSNAEEVAIRDLLAERFGRVSYERLLSGSGLVNIYQALSQLHGRPTGSLEEPRQIRLASRDGNALASRAVQVFCSVFGAFAGDLVLTLGAWDGVYLTGGLVPKLLEELCEPDFRTAFEAKGRFSESLARVPTLAVLHPQAGLLGAAGWAIRDESVAMHTTAASA
ncbi:glucokinase [Pseudomarimonas arenosa]|uniref:Glucokinase n=1 Tax=Pseudomarimonas arenosa TaxID=2774145 RepID=A0AAW3ZPG2_9GAMM|nr:glucokinase [Pseudomarimonas arenosa]MBD8526810.1 glucokinase [Pseudomarimonas arenosa]